MNPAQWLRDARISTKLRAIGLLTAGLALAAVSVILIARDVVEWRARTVTDLRTYAAIIGTNAVSALLFDDRRAAAETLKALAAKPAIVHAVIYNDRGGEFADFRAPGCPVEPMPAVPAGDYRFTFDHLVVAVPIQFKDEIVGSVRLGSRLDELYAGILRSAGLILVAAVSVFLLAGVLFARLQKAIVRPVQALVDVMQAVTTRQDYAVRAEAGAKDEIGLLARTFNEMLEGIEARDRQLARHRDHLEAEVALRTADLSNANARLGEELAERRQAEQRVLESEVRYRGIFEYARDIIYLLAPDGSFVSLSPSFERVTGWPVADWLGRPFAPIVHADDLPQATAAFGRALAGEPTPTFELRILKRSGDYFDAELSITPIGVDVVTGAVGIARDVTERKRIDQEIRRLNEALEDKVAERTRQLLEAQEELVRKEKLAVLGQVAGSVGHELRNPLGVMNNAVYYLQMVLADADESVKEYLGIIKGEIAGADRIVSDLLDSVRTKPPRAETVRLAELVEQTLRKCALPDGVRVVRDIPPDLPPLRVDPLQIGQVLRNLISNGSEAMPEGGVLEISAAPAAPGVVGIAIRDSGVGMTAEQQAKLFQPLFTTKARGIGLGLVVVRNLTRANGGQVQVRSEPGAGTTFTLTLPAAAE